MLAEVTAGEYTQQRAMAVFCRFSWGQQLWVSAFRAR